LILLRHGETTWNRLGIVQGHDDGATLTDKGRQQVRQVLDELRDERVDQVISSDLNRALETAEIVARALGLPHSVDPAIRERSFGVLEGGAVNAATPALTGVDGTWVINESARPQGGESLEDLYRRTAAFVDRVAIDFAGRRVLVVTHGGAIRTMRAYCEGVTMEGRRWDDVSNCSVWRLETPN
jgi:broad specificity phosphatase PhoE